MKSLKFLSGTVFLGTVLLSATAKQNIAPDATITATSVHGNYTAQKAIDGVKNRASRWINKADDSAPAITLKWSSPQKIDQVKVHTGLGDKDPKWIVKKYQIQAEVDGKWQTVAKVADNNKMSNDLTFPIVKTSKIRLTASPEDTAQGMCRLLEIEVFSDGITLEKKKAVITRKYNQVAGKPKPKKLQDIATIADKVFDWQIEHLRDDYKRYHKNDNRLVAWTYGALYVGMEKWAKKSGNEKHYDFLKSIGEENRWNIGWGSYHADEHVVGLTYLDLFRKYKDPKMLTATKNRMKWILDNPSQQEMRLGNYENTQRWTWCDALFMSPPIWAKLSNITGNPAYRDYMFKEYKATTDHLFDPETNLFFRDNNYIKRRKHGRKVFWSRGNGWVLASLPLIISELPEGKQKKYFTDLYLKMAPAIAKLQTPKGHWAMSLLCDDIYPTPETSGTSFFCYALAWGINNGLLDRAEYEPVVMKAWKCLVGHVTPEGMLGYVQPVGASPGSAWPNKSEVYGVGAFLAAASEVYTLQSRNAVFSINKPDFNVSPRTGLTRQHWKDAGVYLLEGAFKHVKSLESPFNFPKLPGKSRWSTGATSYLESMVRTLYIAAPLIKEDPELTINGIKLKDYYLYQLRAICDSDSKTFIVDRANPKGWPNQNLVEFGALAISLFGSPEVIWDPLTKAEQDVLMKKMLTYAHGSTVPSNWRFFNIIIMSFAKSRGYEINEDHLLTMLNKSLAQYRGEGWYNDNPSYDYYSPWGFQYYGIFWAHHFGDKHYPKIAAKLKANFKDMIDYYPMMFGKNGNMLMWGRSISYRLCAGAVFPLAAYNKDIKADWGWLRSIASSQMLQFLEHPEFMKDGVPTLGFYGHFEPAVQSYLTRGSVYWMGKLWCALSIPKDHPFWTASESEGKWADMDEANVYNKFFKGSNILQTNYPGIGASELRAKCYTKRSKHDHGRDSENYNKLSYNTVFPWQADGDNGEASMSYRIKLKNDPKWYSSCFYKFKGYDNGFYKRTLTLQEEPSFKIELNEKTLPNGILRVDTNVSTVPVELRLGHYVLPHLSDVCDTEKRSVNGKDVYIVRNTSHQLALIPLEGWNNGEFVTAIGLHPETSKSTVANIETSFDPGRTTSQRYATLMLWKKAGEKWSDDEFAKSITSAVANITQVYGIAEKSKKPAAFCRFVPERQDDFAWENDKVAFRVYGPALKSSGVKSGIDCWLKRVEYPVINKWYAGHMKGISYHTDHGEGHDPYHVGSSMGCGGLAIVDNGNLIQSGVYDSYKVIKNSPEQVVFELAYSWKMDSKMIKEVRNVSLKLGERLFTVDSQFFANGKPAKVTVVVGLTTHDGRATVVKNKDKKWIAAWEKIAGSQLGTAVVLNSGQDITFKDINHKEKEKSHSAIIATTDTSGRLSYRAGYGWQKAGEIKSLNDWRSYLNKLK